MEAGGHDELTLDEARKLAVLTVTQTHQVMRLGLRQTYEACRRGELPVIRVGRRLLVPTAALLRLLGEEP